MLAAFSLPDWNEVLGIFGSLILRLSSVLNLRPVQPQRYQTYYLPLILALSLLDTSFAFSTFYHIVYYLRIDFSQASCVLGL